MSAPHNVIASRTFHTADGRKVDITVFQPRQGADDWFTDWQIVGLADDVIELSAGGYDALQSLLFGLASLGDRLYSADEELIFCGSKELQLLHSTDIDSADRWSASVSVPVGY